MLGCVRLQQVARCNILQPASRMSLMNPNMKVSANSVRTTWTTTLDTSSSRDVTIISSMLVKFVRSVLFSSVFTSSSFSRFDINFVGDVDSIQFEPAVLSMSVNFEKKNGVQSSALPALYVSLGNVFVGCLDNVNTLSPGSGQADNKNR